MAVGSGNSIHVPTEATVTALLQDSTEYTESRRDFTVPLKAGHDHVEESAGQEASRPQSAGTAYSFDATEEGREIALLTHARVDTTGDQDGRAEEVTASHSDEQPVTQSVEHVDVVAPCAVVHRAAEPVKDSPVRTFSHSARSTLRGEFKLRGLQSPRLARSTTTSTRASANVARRCKIPHDTVIASPNQSRPSANTATALTAIPDTKTLHGVRASKVAKSTPVPPLWTTKTNVSAKSPAPPAVLARQTTTPAHPQLATPVSRPTRSYIGFTDRTPLPYRVHQDPTTSADSTTFLPKETIAYGTIPRRLHEPAPSTNLCHRSGGTEELSGQVLVSEEPVQGTAVRIERAGGDRSPQLTTELGRDANARQANTHPSVTIASQIDQADSPSEVLQQRTQPGITLAQAAGPGEQQRRCTISTPLLLPQDHVPEGNNISAPINHARGGEKLNQASIQLVGNQTEKTSRSKGPIQVDMDLVDLIMSKVQRDNSTASRAHQMEHQKCLASLQKVVKDSFSSIDFKLASMPTPTVIDSQSAPESLKSASEILHAISQLQRIAQDGFKSMDRCNKDVPSSRIQDRLELLRSTLDDQTRAHSAMDQAAITSVQRTTDLEQGLSSKHAQEEIAKSMRDAIAPLHASLSELRESVAVLQDRLPRDSIERGFSSMSVVERIFDHLKPVLNSSNRVFESGRTPNDGTEVDPQLQKLQQEKTELAATFVARLKQQEAELREQAGRSLAEETDDFTKQLNIRTIEHRKLANERDCLKDELKNTTVQLVALRNELTTAHRSKKAEETLLLKQVAGLRLELQAKNQQMSVSAASTLAADRDLAPKDIDSILKCVSAENAVHVAQVRDNDARIASLRAQLQAKGCGIGNQTTASGLQADSTGSNVVDEEPSQTIEPEIPLLRTKVDRRTNTIAPGGPNTCQHTAGLARTGQGNSTEEEVLLDTVLEHDARPCSSILGLADNLDAHSHCSSPLQEHALPRWMADSGEPNERMASRDRSCEAGANQQVPTGGHATSPEAMQAMRSDGQESLLSSLSSSSVQMRTASAAGRQEPGSPQGSLQSAATVPHRTNVGLLNSNYAIRGHVRPNSCSKRLQQGSPLRNSFVPSHQIQVSHTSPLASRAGSSYASLPGLLGHAASTIVPSTPRQGSPKRLLESMEPSSPKRARLPSSPAPSAATKSPRRLTSSVHDLPQPPQFNKPNRKTSTASQKRQKPTANATLGCMTRSMSAGRTQGFYSR